MCSYYGDDLFDEEPPANSGGYKDNGNNYRDGGSSHRGSSYRDDGGYRDRDSDSRDSRRERDRDTESHGSRSDDMRSREFHDEEYSKTTKTSTMTHETTTKKSRAGRGGKVDLGAAATFAETEAEVIVCLCRLYCG